MTVTHIGQGTGWLRSDRLPDRVVASSLYDSAGWLRTWEANPVEQRTRHTYVSAEVAGGSSVVPLYEVTMSPFWHGYEVQCDLVGRFGRPVVFAGSTYSMYSKRGHVPAELARGAHATAMEWISSGDAELLVVPNLTGEGVEDWLAAVGPPVGRVLLERTYSCDVTGTFTDHLVTKLPNKIKRDVERRLRRSQERGLRVRMVEGPDAHELVRHAYPLTVDTSDKNDWPALFTEDALDSMLRVPGAMMLAAEVDDRLVGAFFAFRHGDEVTYMCGGVEYAGLKELSTYVALMYGGTKWAYDNGMNRIEWGRDNYRFKEKHGLTGTDLWALVYAPEPRPDLVPALDGMHDLLSAYIEGT
ncbi:GNAT family N-acetyltransferase [Umezawaea tangerina]|uniref:Acetyltransferase (GNAT) family protein n=1 Tax=Umezawaea tangerina TaxID=84725 RepID=A0A2T0THP1_9PSEU|nr:GNAT family N-acetyltransferase [Umezawaea tangerina]PRY45236.1 acetyltransferase (GNAT) family protein [Umezawaea tangerina]